MATGLPIPYITPGDVERRATEFLDQHHPRRTFPVPVDVIAESAFGIHLTPCTGLDEVAEAHGFITSDLSEIIIDRGVWDCPVQHRFMSTIAHELGHLVMHADLYRSLSFSTVEEYVAFRRDTDPADLNWLEKHANWFMGRVLAPSREIRQFYEERIEQCARRGLAVTPPDQAVVEFVVRGLAQHVQVSEGLARIRLGQEELVPYDMLY